MPKVMHRQKGEPFTFTYFDLELALQAALLNSPPNFNYRSVEFFRVIFDKIICIDAFFDLAWTDGFAPINRAAMESNRNGVTDFAKLVKYLISIKLVLTDNKYIKNIKSIGYKINPAYICKHVVKHPVTIPVLKRAKVVAGVSQKSLPGKYKYLQKGFEGNSLTIDEDAAYIIIEQLYIQTLNKKGKNGGKLKADREFSSGVIKIESYKARKFYISQDSTGRRIHSTFSQTLRELRVCLRWKGEKQVEADVKNSQLLMFCAMINIDFWTDKTDNTHVSTHEGNRIKHKQIRDKDQREREDIQSLSIMKDGLPDNQYGIELLLFRILCAEGIVYDYFQALLYLQGINRSRDQVKKTIITILFSDKEANLKEWMRADPVRMLFKQQFPEIYNLIELIKGDNYNLFSIYLQRIESHLIIDNCTKRINQEYPGLQMFTAHDGIFFIAGNEKEIVSIIEQEMETTLGIVGKVSIKYPHNA